MSKKQFLTLLLVFCSLMVTAQDIIITKSEQAISALVKEVSATEIKYVEATNADGPLCVISTSDVTSILYANGTTQVFEEKQKTQEVKVKHSTSDSYGRKAKPDRFIMGGHIQYSGRNSRSVSGSESDMTDITSGLTFGVDFTHSIMRSLVINYELNFDFNFFADDSYIASMLIPLRFGYQHVTAMGRKKKQYIRLLTGPMFDIGLAGEMNGRKMDIDNHFNCMWDIHAEYQYDSFAFYLGTAWGMYTQSKNYKSYSNMPIYVGFAYKF